MQRAVLIVGTLLVLGGGYWYFALSGNRLPVGNDVSSLPTSTPKEEHAIASAKIIPISSSGAYVLTIPEGWTTEEQRYKGGAIDETDIIVYDEREGFAMKITQPLREIGYEASDSTLLQPLGTGIGALKRILRTDAENASQGFVHYSWDGDDDFWNNSFEIFVFFGDGQYYKTEVDFQTQKGAPFKFRSLGEIQSSGTFRTQIEDIIGGIRPK